MAGSKLVVLYPAPRDVSTFERTYTQDHVPMVTAQNFKGINRSFWLPKKKPGISSAAAGIS